MNAKFVMCINNEGYPIDLTVHKVYKVMPDADAERRKMIRIVDNSGEDYMHSASRFVPVQIPVEAEQNFDLVVA